MYSMVVMAALTTGTSAPDCCGFFRSLFCCQTRSSCNSSCYGCTGCYGCNGCYGGAVYYGCGGCQGGCYGGCYGGYSSSCYGGCHGCYGSTGYMAAPSAYQVVPHTPMPAAGDSAPPPKEEKAKETKEAKAKLIIDVPTDAKLFIDDQPMKTTSARRAFSTPTLEPGQSYYYVLRAEVVRDGKTYELTRRVIVRAGEQVKASFKDLENPSPAYIAKANR